MDLRTVKIYDSLMVAFEELLQEKSFEQITVNELCDRAQTRRATFYKHFSDKYDFYQFMLRQLRERIFREAAERATTDTLKERLHLLVDASVSFVDTHRAFLCAVKNSGVASQMMQTLTDQSVQLCQSNHSMQDVLAMQFLIGGLNQCGRWWLENIQSISKEELQSQLYVLVDQYAALIESDGGKSE